MTNIVVPIVFSFDSNLIMPACVCISSLLANANRETKYDIYILYPEESEFDKTLFQKLYTAYSNFTLTFLPVNGVFKNAFEIREVTVPTYYRLLIPDMLPQYDKVIYADVDMIFRQDLSHIYMADYGSCYIAATYDLGMNLTEDGRKYVCSMPELSTGDYIQAGFLILNCKELRKDRMVEKFIKLVKRNFKYQDQDILNIACRNRIAILPWHYNMTDYSFCFINRRPEMLTDKYANSDMEKAEKEGTLHFNGHKPWKKYCVNFDVWWEYYRKSPVFDKRYYFDFYYSRLNEHDRLPLVKRIKILARYFIYGIRKNP